MRDLFRKIEKTGILVVGDLMVDQYIWGKVKRISPEAPVPVVEVLEDDLHLGGAANVASNAHALEGNVYITGVIGSDETGKILINKLDEKGLSVDGIVLDRTRPTTVKTRVIANNQQVVRFDREVTSEVSRSTMNLILEYIKSCLPKVKGIIISDYCKGLITKGLVKKIVEMAGPKVCIAVDPKIGHFHFYKGVSLITPNINEASFGSGIDIQDEKSLIAAGNVLLKKLGCKAVMITRGDEGMSLFEKNGKITNIPTCAQEVYDVSGAGDTVIAALTLSHASGANLKDAAIIANHAAGVVVAKMGTAVATPKEILKSLKVCKSPVSKAGKNKS